MKTFKQILTDLDACAEAREWAADKTIEEVVASCHRGDWLLWLANKIEIDTRPLTLAKGHCANTVRHLMTDERSVKAVDIAIAFGEGNATEKELVAASSAASAAYAYASAASSAASASASAAASASASASAAAYAAYAASSAAKTQNQLETADICRRYIGDLIIEKVTFKQEEQ